MILCIDNQTAEHKVFGVNLDRFYKACDLNQDELLGFWKHADDLVFFDRANLISGAWAASRPEPQGCYHAFVQTQRHIQNGLFNGVRRDNRICPAGALQLARPQDLIHAMGVGEARALQVAFTGAYLEEHLAGSVISPRAFQLRRQYYADAILLHLALAHRRGLAAGFTGRELHFDLLRQALLNRILVLHARSPFDSKYRECLSPARTKRVIEFIDTNLRSNLRLSELSRVAAVSMAHFARAFRNSVGMAPHIFVVQRRLGRAVELLSHRPQPIQDVAANCGFCDPGHLTRAFKAHMNATPSAFMRQVAQLKRPSDGQLKS